jgi:dihydroneopterin aldolase
MDTIVLNQVRIYAHHGCLAEETVIGSDYLVNLEVSSDLTRSATTDSLEDTVDYVLLNAIISEEMSIPRKLLETVASSILDNIMKRCDTVHSASVSVSKLNPPIGGDVGNVTIKMTRERKPL